MNLSTKTAIAATAAVALASGIYLTSGPEGAMTKVAKSSSGKYVRVVYEGEIAAEEQNTEFGRSLVLNSIPPTAMCNLVFEAPIVTEEGVERPLPGIANIKDLANAGVMPVLISKTDTGTGIWHCLFKGESCLQIAEMAGYIASEMQQMISHPKKQYFLRATAKHGAVDANGHVKYQVPVGDKDVDPAGAVRFSHGWAGRADLNYSIYQDGEFLSVYDVIERGKKEK